MNYNNNNNNNKYSGYSGRHFLSTLQSIKCQLTHDLRQ